MERLHADIKNQRLVARPVLYTVMQKLSWDQTRHQKM